MDGDGGDVGLRHDGVEVDVVGREVGRADAEGAAVDVNQKREFAAAGGGGFGREVEAGGDAGGGVDCDVFGLNAGAGVVAGGEGLGGADEAFDAAVFEETEQIGEFTDDLGGGIGSHGGERREKKEERESEVIN